jgi:cation transport regulator ChaC
MQHITSTEPAFTLFAYGSCMNISSLSATIGVDATRFFLGVARLPGWRVKFNYPSTNGTDFFCNLAPADGDCAFGALFRIPDIHLDAIRLREAWHKQRYREEVLRVQTLQPDAPHVDALVYLANVVVPSEGSPGKRYSQLVLDGARQCGLPPNYVKELQARMELLSGGFLEGASLGTDPSAHSSVSAPGSPSP